MYAAVHEGLHDEKYECFHETWTKEKKIFTSYNFEYVDIYNSNAFFSLPQRGEIFHDWE